MKITTTNVTKVISVSTGVYWILAGFACCDRTRLGYWRYNSDGALAVILLTGTCGVAFWGMIAPTAFRAWWANPLPRSLGALTRGLWYVSTIPIVLLCFGLFCRLIYYRITE